MDGDQELTGTGDLTSDDELLLVATAEFSRQGVDALTASHIEALDDRLGVLGQVVGVEDPPLAERRVVILLDGHILKDPGRHDQTPLLPVLGNMSNPHLVAPPHIGMGDVIALDDDRPALDVPQSGDRLDELTLSIAVDAGDPDDLPP